MIIIWLCIFSYYISDSGESTKDNFDSDGPPYIDASLDGDSIYVSPDLRNTGTDENEEFESNISVKKRQPTPIRDSAILEQSVNTQSKFEMIRNFYNVFRLFFLLIIYFCCRFGSYKSLTGNVSTGGTVNSTC